MPDPAATDASLRPRPRWRPTSTPGRPASGPRWAAPTRSSGCAAAASGPCGSASTSWSTPVRSASWARSRRSQAARGPLRHARRRQDRRPRPRIDGRPVVVFGDDITVRQGSSSEVGSRKEERLCALRPAPWAPRSCTSARPAAPASPTSWAPRASPRGELFPAFAGRNHRVPDGHRHRRQVLRRLVVPLRHERLHRAGPGLVPGRDLAPGVRGGHRRDHQLRGAGRRRRARPPDRPDRPRRRHRRGGVGRHPPLAVLPAVQRLDARPPTAAEAAPGARSTPTPAWPTSSRRSAPGATTCGALLGRARSTRAASSSCGRCIGRNVTTGVRPHRRLAGRRRRHQPDVPGRRPRRRRLREGHPPPGRCATPSTCRCCSCRTCPASWSAAVVEHDRLLHRAMRMLPGAAPGRCPTLTVMRAQGVRPGLQGDERLGHGGRRHLRLARRRDRVHGPRRGGQRRAARAPTDERTGATSIAEARRGHVALRGGRRAAASTR